MINIDLSIKKKIHMIGIGGVSMSGIAEILLRMGFKVSGSDINKSPVTNQLENQGVRVIIGHFPENVHDADIVVYTAAIKEDNPEIMEAKALNKILVERSDFMGNITKLYKDTIAVSGNHGKTTTTGMISSIFINAGKSPTVQLGANLPILNNTNYTVGTSSIFIVEACEYVRSFLKFFPKVAIVLNIEEDHLDYYKDIDDITGAFDAFLDIPGKDGMLVVNADDDRCMKILNNHEGHKITFGINNKEATWRATQVFLAENKCYAFEATNKDTNESIFVTLNVYGYHNIYNALAAVAVARAYDISLNDIKEALANFRGTSRRFEYIGTYKGISIFDDYAHHPTEIRATIKSALNLNYKNLWIVFQPHTYTRTYALFDEFATAFEGATKVILTDIYAAREKDTGLVSAKDLADKINEHSKNCVYIPSFDEIESYLKENMKAEDVLLTIGAGNITDLGRNLVK